MITEIEMGMMEEHPKSIKCPYCSGTAFRFFGSTAIKIPESFKATSDIYGGDSYANGDTLKSMFKKGKRPSGKDRVYY